MPTAAAGLYITIPYRKGFLPENNHSNVHLVRFNSRRGHLSTPRCCLDPAVTESGKYSEFVWKKLHRKLSESNCSSASQVSVLFHAILVDVHLYALHPFLATIRFTMVL
jgi:hypothetical protein